MTNRLDLCIEGLRLLARSSELEATRLMTAEIRIREFLAPATSNPDALRASLEQLDDAVNLEAELRPREATFWQGIAAILATAVGQYPQQLDIMAIEEGNHPVV